MRCNQRAVVDTAMVGMSAVFEASAHNNEVQEHAQTNYLGETREATVQVRVGLPSLVLTTTGVVSAVWRCHNC